MASAFLSRFIAVGSLVLALSAATGPAVAGTGKAVYKAVHDAVVSVVPLDANGRPVGHGSGVAITRNLVVTNCHVTTNADRVSVAQFLDTDDNIEKWEVEADLRYGDSKLDLCILQTEHSLSFSDRSRPARIGSVAEVLVGERVYALGNPHPYILTFAEGSISQFRACRDMGYFGRCPSEVVLQHDASTSRGSSGGGLFNANAELIGITTFVHKEGNDLNFAIPADWIYDLVEYDRIQLANAIFYAKLGLIEVALEFAESIKDRLKRARTIFKIAKTFLTLAEGKAALSDEKGARKLMGAAKSIFRYLDDPSDRASLLRRIAVLQHSLGETVADTLKEAWDNVSQISKPVTRARALVRTSCVEALVGNCDRAKTELANAREIKLMNDDQRERLDRLIALKARQLEKKASTCTLE